MTAPLGGQQITRLRAPAVSDGRHGGLARDWAAATATDITGVSVQPFATGETTLDQAYIRDRLRVFDSSGTDYEPTDRIVYEGDTYEVDGDPQPWTDLAGRASHVELVIKRLAG